MKRNHSSLGDHALSSLHKCHTGTFTLVCATVLAALPASNYASAMEKPNILFLMRDDWSAPHAGILVDPVVKTPAFDRIARERVLFRNAFVSSPSCTPSRLAIATGQWHWRLEDGKNLGGALREGVPVYPEMLQAAGYQIGFAHKGAAPSDSRPRLGFPSAAARAFAPGVAGCTPSAASRMWSGRSRLYGRPL